MVRSAMFSSSHVIFRFVASNRASIIENAYTPYGKLLAVAPPVAATAEPTRTLPPVCQKPFVCPATLLCGPSECEPPVVLGIQYPSQFVNTSADSPLLLNNPNRNCWFPQLKDVFVTNPEKVNLHPGSSVYPWSFVPMGAYTVIPAPPQVSCNWPGP